MVNLKQIRHAMIDQRLDKMENDVEEELGKDLLNQKPTLPKGIKIYA